MRDDRRGFEGKLDLATDVLNQQVPVPAARADDEFGAHAHDDQSQLVEAQAVRLALGMDRLHEPAQDPRVAARYAMDCRAIRSEFATDAVRTAALNQVMHL
jgi:hypothetical protein